MDMEDLRAHTLYEQLPSNNSVSLKEESPPAVSLPEKDDTFQEPTLKIKSDHAPWESPIIVISAPGAVGKTSLAKDMCAEKSVHLWNLSRLDIGEGSFKGVIADSFGTHEMAPTLERLSEGEELFVLDAFDEADMLVGWERVENFVNECWQVVGDSPNTSLVFLARSRTAEYLVTALELASLGGDATRHPNPCGLLEIDYFDQKQALSFIDRQMYRISQERDDDRVLENYRQYEEPFYDAVESIFDAAGRSFREYDDIWESEEVRSFLGYAPVLQAISNYLADPDHGNYHDVERKIENDEIGGELDITSNLISDLLYRERQKVLSKVESRVEEDKLDKVDKERIYSDEEQLKRILIYLDYKKGNCEAEEVYDEDYSPRMPGWVFDEYKDIISTLIPEHPFLVGEGFTGPAFRDYLYAEALKWGGTDLQKKARTALLESDYTATPLLLWFYKDEDRNLVNSKDIGFVYESFSSKDSLHEESSFIEIYPDEEKGAGKRLHSAMLSRFNSKGESKNVQYNLKIRPEGEDPEVFFPRKVENAIVYVKGKVILGNNQNEIKIVDSEIRSNEIELRSSSVVVKSKTEGQSVLMRTDDFRSIPSNVQIKTFGEGELAIQWPGGQSYPWSDYYQDIESIEEPTDKHAFAAVRRILMCFQKDRRSDLARYIDYVENIAVGESSTKKEMLSFLMDKNIVYKDSPLYKLDISKLSDYGINWADVHKGDPHEEISYFLNEFRDWR